MILSKLRRRFSGDAPLRPDRAASVLPPVPLDSGVLSCQVQGEQGRLLLGATVAVVDGTRNQRIAEGQTDAYGYFVAAVPPGKYRVSVTAGGYKRASTQVEVQVNRQTSVGSVHLEPDASLELPGPGVWRFDPYHTEVRFIAQHIGMSKIHGKFREFEGLIRVDRPFERSRIEIAIDAASIDTGVKMRDDHLRSEDFLDVANFPRLFFTSDRLTHVRGDRWMVNGRLTLRGTTSPVQLETTYLGQRKWQGPGFDGDHRVACLATTVLRREDYAVNWKATLAKGIAVVGPTVTIELGVQAVLEQ
ncbi:YceI family protein [Saccharopolyspora erythraea]|uniref:YceI family protein n=1 Tax=Saccharopolyspora erythraea TaxID=1836 RepID=UPI001BAD9D88|nr:YceI family protein [Saccharopolyspora erythraea]QUH00787.1 YceI family protein [Saccharopolyspora erythraea]